MRLLGQKVLFPALAAAAWIGVTPVSALADAAEDYCTGIYPSWYQLLDRKKCISSRRRDEEARSCIFKHLAELEATVGRLRDGVTGAMTLDQAKAAAEKVLNQKLTVTVPEDEPSDRLVEAVLSPDCKAAFHFLIHIRAAAGGELRHVNVWARFPPRGYQDGYQAKLSKDFDALKRRRAADAKRQRIAAAKRRARDAQHRRQQAEEARLRAAAAARAEAARKRAAEDARRRREAEIAKRRLAWAPPPVQANHCAQGLAKAERLRRLGKFGTVRRTAAKTYRAGSHSVSFGAKDKEVTACQ